ncbi:SpoIIE family protein phosphatase [Streptomyces sp. MST-110588]|uniref:SpoIIE family protein phosphatase n=1 Tax=Streptomyces sp. MST-110588 TaxID=2833628 RepID=UPI001F5D8234|nr:SpoIIE family protein phosphatase [Streptomyces sp. MST-110588]UNO43145.1 serine/threonine-protein phosphatase [Streptomyces sp. MST-110588]
MADRGAKPPAASPPDDWPAHPDLMLALNGMGGFDWDLDSGLLHMDDSALKVFDLTPEEYDSRPATLSCRLPPDEGARLDALVSRALKDGSTSYGGSFRIRLRDGTPRRVHTRASIRRDGTGRPHRIIGVIQDADQEYDQEYGQESDHEHGQEHEHGDDRAARLPAVVEEAPRHTGVVERTTAALAHARTVHDVIAVLGDAQGLSRLGAQNVIVGLVEAGRIRLVSEGRAGSFVPDHELTRVDDEFPMSEVVRTLAPRFVRSRQEFATHYPRLWPHVEPLDIGSAAYLPLIAQARPIGVIGLFYQDEHPFGAQERSLLIALGSGIAQSLARAMLYDQEHDLAEGLQQAMLPRRIPGVPGAQIAVRYHSARLGRDIGGDWYDVIPLPAGRVAAVIGDVQGHDTQAAAVMGQLRIVLRAYATEGHAPATVMARASAFLRELDTDRFATCTYADADLTTGAVRFVRAGHIDPLLRHAEGICRRLPVAGGLPLGLSAEFAHLDYPVTTVHLTAGDTLLLFTDGLVEQPGTDLDDGMRQLAREVREGPQDVQRLADRLCESAAQRSAGDDMALLLLRRSGTPPRPATGRFQQQVAPADPEALSAARQMVRTAVRSWGARERSEEIELVAHELITNALLHTDGAATVAVSMPPGAERRLRLEVEDCSSTLPRRREPGEAGVSGRGMLLVDRLADVWGVEPRGTGKCVWCEFACP